jgi:hypothetical protein
LSGLSCFGIALSDSLPPALVWRGMGGIAARRNVYAGPARLDRRDDRGQACPGSARLFRFYSARRACCGTGTMRSW